MGAHLTRNADQIRAAEADLAKLNSGMSGLDKFQMGLDGVGIFDPTPISDGVNAIISGFRGDWAGAGLSGISAFPYFGDLAGKGGKAGRFAAKAAALKKKIEATKALLNKLKYGGQKNAAAAVRAKRAAEAAKKCAKGKVKKNCTPASNRFGTKLPADEKGTWSGEKGNSVFTPRDGGPAVEYKNGYPDFSPHVYNHNGKPASVEIDMNGTSKDFTAANQEMRKIDPNWRQPEGYTWHHKEDGATMQLVPTKVNATPHTGGASIARDMKADPGY